MFDEKLRRMKDSLLTLFKGRWMQFITPNQMTTLAFFAGLTVPVFLYLDQPVMAFSFWILNRILDGMDGWIARERNMKSDFGAYYDILTDFVVYSLIPLAIAFVLREETVYWTTMILLAVFYVNGASWMFLSALIEKRGGEIENNRLTTLGMPRGLIEGGETIVFYSLFILMPEWITGLMIAMAIMTAAGIFQRIIFARKVLSSE